MLAIGRALMSRPKLMLLDEPSMGLAPKIVSNIFDIIIKINREGTTILLVEQNARMALSIADKVLSSKLVKSFFKILQKNLIMNKLKRLT